MVAYLAWAGRPVHRNEVAALLWGPGKLVNLRQELAALRKLEGADAWLREDGAWIEVQGETDLARIARLRRDGTGDVGVPEGALLEGLEIGTVAFDDWLTQLGDSVDALRQAGVSTTPTSGTGGAKESVYAALRVAGRSVTAAELVHALDVPAWVVVDALADERAKQAAREPSADVARWLRQRLALARRAVEGQSMEVAEELRKAGCVVEADSVCLVLAREGVVGAADYAATVVQETECKAEVLRLAAEQASRRGDAAGFQRHQQALARLAADTQRADLLAEASLLVCRGALMRGAWDDARRAADEAAGLWESTSVAARAALWRGQVDWMQGHFAGAAQALARAARDGDAWTRAAALSAMGAMAGRQGSAEEAERYHAEALLTVRRIGDRDAAARLLNNLGASADRAERPADALELFAEAERLALLVGDGDLLRTTRLNRAEQSRRMGALGESRATLMLVLEGLDAKERPRTRAMAWQIRGDIEAACGRWEEARAWAQRAEECWVQAGDAAAAQHAAWNAALALEMNGRLWLSATAFDRLWKRKDAIPRADSARLAAAELLLLAPDSMRREAAWQATNPAPRWLQHVRAAFAGELEAIPLYMPVEVGLARAKRMTEAEWEAAVERHGRGLLPGQQRGLRERFVGWRRRGE